MKLAREYTYTAYPAIIDLPSCVKPTANFASKMPPKRMKSRHSSALSIPARTSAPNGSLLPFKVVLHASRPSPYVYPPVTYAKNDEERQKKIEEDRVNAYAQMGIVHFKKDVLKVDRSPILLAKPDASSPVSKVSSKTGREVLYFNER